MNEQQVRAMFLLADIPVVGLTRVENGYWPDGPDHKELREMSPWWLVDTGRGELEIGDRKRVVEIEWGGLGIVFPFVDQDGRDLASDKHFIKDPNITKWHTGCHAWGYGQAVSALTNLKRCMMRHDYLTEYWSHYQFPEQEKRSWLIVARKAHWVKDMEDRIEVTIDATNQTFALQEFYKQYPRYRVSIIDTKEHRVAERERLSICG